MCDRRPMCYDQTMSIEEILLAIRMLPVAERLHVIERVAHDVAGEVRPEVTTAEAADVKLIEHHGMLLVDANETLPADVFDHRSDRDARAERIWRGA